MQEYRRATTTMNRRLPGSERRDAVPFFSRMSVIHGISLTGAVLLVMGAITYQQLQETLREIERSSIEKGRAVATALTPLILSQVKSTDALRKYFDEISRAAEIDYVQVVDRNGRVVVGSSQRAGERNPDPLNERWLELLERNERLDATAVHVPWGKGLAGVDVYMALVADSDKASVSELRAANHLRIGVNFDRLVQEDTPRVIRRMLLVSLLAAAVLLTGLLGLLNYLMRPVKDLQRGLRAVAAGDLTYQVPVRAGDEMGMLAKTFNATISRMRQAVEQIETMATRDPLTALHNRRVFDERLELETARCRRYGHSVGLILLDLDHFKQINDSFGHPVGDEVLRVVASTLAAGVRETDLIARIGGEEFAVILPETDFSEVRAVAEKLRLAVAEVRFRAEAGAPPGLIVTISCGGVAASGRLITAAQITTAADHALYQSKANGRNRVTMARALSE